MSDADLDIAPAKVPLSHHSGAVAGRPEARAESRLSPWLAPIGLGALVIAAAVLLWWAGDSGRGERASVVINAEPSSPRSAQEQQAPATTQADNALPPFAASQQALARDRAQSALARFVEQQIALEDAMAVGAWGQTAFDEALAAAAAGDEAFVEEQFEPSQAAYEQAADALGALIEEGQARIETAIAEGQQAIDDRQQEAALAAFKRALTIDPDNQAAVAGIARTNKLPDVKRLLLQARNQELAGNWQGAKESYAELAALDPETRGLQQLRSAADAAVGSQALRDTLSRGFAALDARRYAEARKAFNSALAMDAGNEVALGGLQQVTDRTELSEMARLERDASAAVAGEDWNSAVALYQRALKLDSNIQFAKAGLGAARAQARAASTLGEIVAAPNKLSSKQLMSKGREALAQARTLKPRGPKLAALIERSDALLTAYAQPVTVQLTSDNRTEVLVSTVGKLGAFAARELSLRPGEYVLLGSRAGCRDVRRTVVVAPDMQPVDIRCEEPLSR